MSSSIPIPARPDVASAPRHLPQACHPPHLHKPHAHPLPARATLHQPQAAPIMAVSLPAAHTLGGLGAARSTFTPMPPAAAAAAPAASSCVMQDAVGLAAAADQAEAGSWPPRPKLELVSRSARRWASSGDGAAPRRGFGRPAFDPDFSLVASAVDSVRDALRTGRAGVERPPRDSVSGTYFFRRVESGQSVQQLGDDDGGFGAMFGHPGAADDCFADARAAAAPTAGTYSGGFAGGPGAFGAERTRDSLTLSPPLGSYAGDRFGSGDSFSLGASLRGGKSKKVTAVFKPADEEPGESSPSDSLVSSPIPSLPRASPEFNDGGSRAARMAAAGFHAGEGAYKEVAAYILDKGFAGVPQTALACYTRAGADGDSVALTNADGTIINDGKGEGFEHEGEEGQAGHLITKMGAVQVYCENVGDADDWGPGLFPCDSIHRIAVLDIRTLNYDRHGGNILVTKAEDGSYDLVPIDHAFTLPETVQAVPWAIWMDWPAAKKPMNQETLDYIASLEPDLDVRHLHEELDGAIRPRSIRSLKIATHLLQRGAVSGLSLYEIGKFIYVREGEAPSSKSLLEKIVDEAIESSERRIEHMGDVYSLEPDDSTPSGGIFRLDSPKPPRSPPPPSAQKALTESYIIRYASRAIDEQIRRVVDSKDSGNGGRQLGRARSMHDFGFNLGQSAAAAVQANAKFDTLSNGVYDPAVDAEPFSFKTAGSPQYMPQDMPSSHVSPLAALLAAPAGEGMATVLGRTSSIGVSFAVARAAHGDGDQTPKLARGKSSPVSPHDMEWHTDSSSP